MTFGFINYNSLSLFHFINDTHIFVCNNETEGYNYRHFQEYFEISPFNIKESIDKYGRTLISHTHLLENVKKIKSKSIEDSKRLIKDYFSEVERSILN